MQNDKFSVASPSCNMPRAGNVASLAREMILSGKMNKLEIEYLRKPQAERERLEKEKAKEV